MDKIKLLEELNKLKDEIEEIADIKRYPDYVRDTETDLSHEPYESDSDYQRSWQNVDHLIDYFCGLIEYIGDEVDDIIRVIRDDVEFVEREPIKPSPGQLPLFKD